MCGRYTLRTPKNILEEKFGSQLTLDYHPRFNIAPSQQVLVLAVDENGRRQWQYLKWGLIPPWAKDATIAHKLINARSETVMEKPAFKQAFRRRRCLVAADGFYEWKAEGSAKQPYLFSMSAAEPFAFAGLWETWHDRSAGQDIKTCNILTKPADPVVSQVHHRMPLILFPADYDVWLDPAAPAETITKLLSPPQVPLRAQRVSRAVNNARLDLEICIEPEI